MKLKLSANIGWTLTTKQFDLWVFWLGESKNQRKKEKKNFFCRDATEKFSECFRDGARSKYLEGQLHTRGKIIGGVVVLGF